MQRNISIVVPVKEEAESIGELYDRVVKSMRSACPGVSFEIIFVDDGSSDDTWAVIQALSQRSPQIVNAVRFRRNMGKALALEAGFRICQGDIIFTMDADLQDDPKEIPRFLKKIDDGFELVSGWKRTRHDPLSKTLPSKLFNRVTAKLTGVKLNDFNCGFKCYKREVIDRIHLYGELHRYIPVLVADLGYRIGEIEVEHSSRVHGRSKYGWERYIRGFIDLITILATTRWLVKPGHLFGGIGIFLGLIGGILLAYLSFIRLVYSEPIGNRPLLAFGILAIMSSLQMLSLGVIAEYLVKQVPLDLGRYISSEIRSKAFIVDSGKADSNDC